MESVKHRMMILEAIKNNQPVLYNQLDYDCDLDFPHVEVLPNAMVELFKEGVIKAEVVGVCLTYDQDAYINGIGHSHQYRLTEKGETLLDIT